MSMLSVFTHFIFSSYKYASNQNLYIYSKFVKQMCLAIGKLCVTHAYIAPVIEADMDAM